MARTQGFTGVYMGVHENTGVYRGIHGCTWEYRGLQEYTWVYIAIQGFTTASQAWQKWVELKITYRVSVIDVWDWEITVRDWKITRWDYKITVWEIKSALREWKNVMRDHNYQSRVKNCHVGSILTVDNEKSLCEKKKSPFEIIDWFFSEPVRHIQSAESILAGFSLILRSV